MGSYANDESAILTCNLHELFVLIPDGLSEKYVSENVLSDSDAGQAWPPLSSNTCLSHPMSEGMQDLGNENGRIHF